MIATQFNRAQIFKASCVIAMWGVNFIVIKYGLKTIPPFLMGALRFGLVAFPAIFFIPRPKVPLKWLVAYGLTICLGQFAFLFLAMANGMPAGLTSLVLQSQAFFTVGLSILFFSERLRPQNLIGMSLAALGLLVLISVSMGSGRHSIPLSAFALTLAAALSWASGNLVSKKIGATHILGLVVWGSLFPIPAFLGLSLAFEGWSAIQVSIVEMNISTLFCVLYIAYGASLIGYTLWGQLIAELPASKVAPLSLLVPIIGLSSAWVWSHEILNPTQLMGAILVFSGLTINTFGATIWRQLKMLTA